MQPNTIKKCDVDVFEPECVAMESQQHDSNSVLVQRELTMPPISSSEVSLPTFHKAMQELINDAISSVPGLCDGKVQARLEIMVMPFARVTLSAIE